MKISYFVGICVIIISCYLTQATAKCPSAEVLLPCTCSTETSNDSYIVCGGNQYYNLKNVFVKISSSLNEDEKHFKMFYFQNSAINEIERNVFHDITFEIIHISRAYNLTQINTHAFLSTNGFVKQFILLNTPYGNTITDNNNIFNALNAMINIEWIEIYNTSITSIPSHAFTVLKKLYWLHLQRNQIKSIGDYAFYDLNNLNLLYFGDNPLQNISDHAFSFRDKNNKSLAIVLPTTQSISNLTFSTINRPLDLGLYIGTELKYLDKNIFSAVLANGNLIRLYGTPLECDCRMYWLYENRALYQKYLYYAKCTDGESVFDDRPAYNECKTVCK